MSIIFLADDDVTVQNVLGGALIKEGYDVHVFGDGQKAMDSLSDIKPDLVITDILMPNKDGFELIIRVKEVYPSCKTIAISKSGPESDMDLLEASEIAYKVDATFSKPMVRDEVIKKVKELLG